MNERRIYSFEGLDGAGKTTNVAHLRDHLQRQGYAVYVASSPSRGFVGRTIRRNLDILSPAQKERYCLYDIKRVNREISKEMQIILWDRHIDSIYVSNYEPDYDQVLNRACGIPKPNKVFLLNIPPNLALEREKNVTDHKLSYNWLVQKYERYNILYERDPARFYRIDATQSLDEVYRELKQKLDDELKKIVD